MGREARIMSVRQVTGPLRRITGDAVAQAIRRRRIIRLWRRSINIVRTVVAIVGNGGGNRQSENPCGNGSTSMIVMMKTMVMTERRKIMVMMAPMVMIPVMPERDLHG